MNHFSRNSFFVSIFILVFLSTNGQETYLKIGNPAYCYFSRDYQKLIFIYQDHIILHSLNDAGRDSLHIPAIGDMPSNHNVHFLNGKVTFSKKGSGFVYQVIDGVIKRVDRSLDHNFQKDALEFVKNDTLFRHGGYAFWEARNFFTYFSTQTFEWEILRPVKGEALPPGLFMHQAQLFENEIFIYGGLKINPTNPNRHDRNEEVWKFSFSDQSWKKLGNFSSEFMELYKVLEWWRIPDIIRIVDRNEGYITNQQWLYKINLSENKFWTLPAQSILKRIDTRISFSYFIYNNYIYFYEPENNHQTYHNYNLNRIPLEKINNPTTSYERFYESESRLSWEWALLAFPAIGVTLFLRKRSGKRKKPSRKAILTSNGLRYKEVDYSLSATARNVLNLLLSESEDVPSSKIMELTSKPGLDYPNQVRLKNQVIRTLNIELRSIFRTNDDLIQQNSSDIDRRIKCYRVDRNWFDLSEKITQ